MSGIYVTSPGASVPYAADYQFVFNSDWPSLAIAYETVLSVVGGYGADGIATHNLGFFPFTVVWDITGGNSVGRAYNGIYIDKSAVHVWSQSAAKTYLVRCYNLDISKQVTYKLPTPPVIKTAYDPTTGIKVSKYGKPLGSTDLRDFILHSRAQSPAVLTVLTTPTNTTGSGTLTYTIAYSQPANYTPWVFGFSSTTGASYQIVQPGPAQALPSLYPSAPSDNLPYYKKGQIVLRYGNNGSGTNGLGSLVVLRDPLVVANTKRVVY